MTKIPITQKPTPSAETEKVPQALIFPQVKAALTAAIGYFIGGTIIGWSASVITELDNDFKMTVTEYSLVVSMISYGALVGSVISGKTMDSLGRRRIMMATAPLTACGWAVIGSATSIYAVYIGRLACGISAGILFTACPVYTSETCQAAIRGRLCSLPSLNLSVGILGSYVIGGLFHWRVSAFLCILPIPFFYIILSHIPESPYWYLLHGNPQGALESLTSLRGPSFDAESELKLITQKLSEVGIDVTWQEFLKRRTLLPLAISLFMQTLQQFCGANVIVLYTSRIFEASKSSVDTKMATIYTGVSQLLGTLVSLLLIDRYGRGILLTVSVALCGIWITTLGVYFTILSSFSPWPSWSPLVIILLFLFSYWLGCGTIPWLIGSEIFNTSIRSKANSVSIFYNGVLNILVAQIYPYTVQTYGHTPVFLAFGAFNFMFAIGTFLFVPETKGKSLEEIQEYFEGRTSKKCIKTKSHP